LIIAVSLAVIVSSGSVTFTGVATPLLVLGSVLATIGAGLLYTLDIGTGSGHWIGYQALAGLGWGAGFQIPIIIGQGTADAADIAPVTAIIVCKLHPMRPLRVWTMEITVDISLPNCRCCVTFGSGAGGVC
jgi:hypothetical protein